MNEQTGDYHDVTWTLQTGDLVRFDHDGEMVHGIVKYRKPEPRPSKETTVYSVALESDVNANGYTYVVQSRCEKVGHVDDFGPRFTPTTLVDALVEEHAVHEDAHHCEN